MMLESPELRWSFIRKIYTIVSIQLLLTMFVTSVVVTVHPISHFFATTRAGSLFVGKVILEAVILTAIVVISLTLYTFWAARNGQDFNFLGPFPFGAIIVLLLFSVIQIFFPLDKISVMIYGGLASIIFCGYLINDTDNLIKRYTYDEYIRAAVALYLDVINLFLSLSNILRAADG